MYARDFIASLMVVALSCNLLPSNSPSSGNYIEVVEFTEDFERVITFDLEDELSEYWISSYFNLLQINEDHFSMNDSRLIIPFSISERTISKIIERNFNRHYLSDNNDYWIETEEVYEPIHWNSAISDPVLVRTNLIKYTIDETLSIVADTIVSFHSTRENLDRWSQLTIHSIEENQVHGFVQTYKLFKDSLETTLRLNRFFSEYVTLSYDSDTSIQTNKKYTLSHLGFGNNRITILRLISDKYLILYSGNSLYSYNLLTSELVKTSDPIGTNTWGNIIKIYQGKIYYSDYQSIREFDPTTNESKIVISYILQPNFGRDVALSITNEKLYVNYLGKIDQEGPDKEINILQEYDFSTKQSRTVFEYDRNGSARLISNVLTLNGKNYVLLSRHNYSY